MALVSVIIPYYKKINQINETLSSVLAQSFQDLEVILVYDDTEIRDLNIIKDKFKNNTKIKIIRNPKNLGAGISRNIGIKNSNAEYIAFLDSDDLWHHKKLEKQITFMKENNYDFTYCNYVKKKFGGKDINVDSIKKRITYEDLLSDCTIGLSTVIIKKRIIKEELFPPLKTKEDYTAWLKLTKNNFYAYNLPYSLVTWNYSKDSLSSSLIQKLKDGFIVYYKYEKFSFLKSIFYLLKLSINSLKRKF